MSIRNLYLALHNSHPLSMRIMKTTLFLLCLFMAVKGPAQMSIPALDMHLQPYRMIGHDNPLRRNLSFDNYKTRGIHRTIGSYFSFGNFSIANEILVVEGVPLYKRDKMRARDVFRFELDRDDTLVSVTECKAILRKDETFRLFKEQDSSFYGARNTDLLEARIRLSGDTAHIWQVLAGNLNGSKEEEQKGVIRNGGQEIRFVKTVLLLREKAVDKTDIQSLMATANIVYSFTCNEAIVAAVSYRATGRKIWFKEKLDETTKNVIASVASLLTLRRDLYY